jgi:hypothetical protein
MGDVPSVVELRRSQRVTLRDAVAGRRWFAGRARSSELPQGAMIMSVAGESGGRARQMREKAQELKQAAERASDPQERQRLEEKAKRLQSQSEQESSMGGGDIYPPQ